MNSLCHKMFISPQNELEKCDFYNMNIDKVDKYIQDNVYYKKLDAIIQMCCVQKFI